jgi:hypothetical protein
MCYPTVLAFSLCATGVAVVAAVAAVAGALDCYIYIGSYPTSHNLPFTGVSSFHISFYYYIYR